MAPLLQPAEHGPGDLRPGLFPHHQPEVGSRREVLVGGAQQVGGAAQCLQLAVDYTKERVQFGRPLASFQAIKHRVAEMMVRMETARSTVRGVAARVAQGRLDDAALAAEVAAGEKKEWVARVIPSVAYTDPEIAWVGVTETEAKAKGLKIGVGKFPWVASAQSRRRRLRVHRGSCSSSSPCSSPRW